MKTATALLRNFLAGKFYSATFDGASQFASRAVSGSKLGILGDVTVACFFRADPTAADANGVLARSGLLATDTAFWLGYDAAAKRLKFTSSDGTSLQTRNGSSSSAPLGTILHAGAVRSGGNVQLYLNGSPDGAAQSVVTPLNAPANATIGATSAVADRLKGQLAEVAVYARALSAAEMAQLATGDIPLLGLMLFVPCWDGSGATLTDISSYGSNFAISNGGGFSALNYPLPTRNGRLRFADLYTITTLSGITARYAAGDFDLKVGGVNYPATGARFQRSRIGVKVGLEVSEMNLTVYANSSDMLGSNPFIIAARKGVLDGANLRVDRAVLLESTALVIGTAINFIGMVADCELSRGKAKLLVRSQTQLLNSAFPKHLFQPGCVHTLYDVGCTLDRNLFKVSGTVASGSTDSSVRSSSFGQATGYFDLGYIQFTSGALSGQRATVKAHTAGSPAIFKLMNPFEVVPSIGDAFDAYPGCDKQLSTCVSKFNNRVSFLGTPNVPVPETAF